MSSGILIVSLGLMVSPRHRLNERIWPDIKLHIRTGPQDQVVASPTCSAPFAPLGSEGTGHSPCLGPGLPFFRTAAAAHTLGAQASRGTAQSHNRSIIAAAVTDTKLSPGSSVVSLFNPFLPPQASSGRTSNMPFTHDGLLLRVVWDGDPRAKGVCFSLGG